jgi:hypothetical protein
MKWTPVLLIVLVMAIAPLISAKTPTPNPTPSAAKSPGSTPAEPSKVSTPSSAQPAPAEKNTSPAEPVKLMTPGITESTERKASPSPAPTPEALASPTEPVATAAANPAVNANNPPPKPILYLMATEAYTVRGKNFIRHRYDVLNKAEYPAEMFAAAPSLPPCGSNTNASRTWVDFFDSTGKRLYGFCALGSPADLGKIWVAFEEGVVPPSYVYIELNDRQTNTKLKSNLAETIL